MTSPDKGPGAGDKKTTQKRRVGDGTPGPGRPKGTPNKTTSLLKDAVLQAATAAGGRDGLVGYLTQQAAQNPAPFLALLGKVLPLQVTGDGGGPLHVTAVVRRIVDPSGADPD